MPEDLEEFLRRGQERLRTALPPPMLWERIKNWYGCFDVIILVIVLIVLVVTLIGMLINGYVSQVHS